MATRVHIADHAPATGFTCTFDLYKLRESATKPDDGVHLATCTREFKNQGYHRVALDAPVYLHAGDRLGIVVQQTHIDDNGVKHHGAEAQENDHYRKIHPDPVYGESIINEGESIWKLNGLTDHHDESQEGWLDITAPITEEMLRYFKDDSTEELINFYINNYVGMPICDFFNIDNFCIKAFGEPYEFELEHVDAQAPSCEDAGIVEHWRDTESGATFLDADGTKPLEDISAAPLGHDWGKPTYEWAKDNSNVTATSVCSRDASHVLTETVDTQHVSNATCTKAGKAIWVAEFEGEQFAKQTKTTDEAPFGHSWDKPTYTWAKDGATATAKRVCKHDADHVETETVATARKVTKKPTCTAAGSANFTATFQNKAFVKQTKNMAVTKLGHKWGATTYTATFDVAWTKAQTRTEAIPATGIPSVSGRAHAQGTGWLPAVVDGVVGTTGQSKRLEALALTLNHPEATGGIEYRTHIQGIGWEDTLSRNGETSGTTGISRRVEAVQIRLHGDVAKECDVYYRVHAQGYGWMGWAKNGAKAGTEAQSRRLEAVQVVLVKKGAAAPKASLKGEKQTFAKAFAKG